jgi:signal peptidase II
LNAKLRSSASKRCVPARSDIAILAGVAVSVFLADQISKVLLVGLVGPGSGRSAIELVIPWIELEYTQNRGAAFGLFPNLGLLVAVAAIAVLFGLLWQFARESQPPRWQTMATGAIAGGALGNLMDRVRLGYVVDFIAVGPWPNFNVADSAVTIGALLLCWGWIRSSASSDANAVG